MIKDHEYKSELARRWIEEGRQEGQRDAIVTLATQRFGELSAAVVARIRATTDDAVLHDLLIRAATDTYDAFVAALPH